MNSYIKVRNSRPAGSDRSAGSSMDTPAGRLTWIWRSASAVGSSTSISRWPAGLMNDVDHSRQLTSEICASFRGGTDRQASSRSWAIGTTTIIDSVSARSTLMARCASSGVNCGLLTGRARDPVA